jgi:hypothetical protein
VIWSASVVSIGKTVQASSKLEPTGDRKIDQVPLMAVTDLNSAGEAFGIPVLESPADRGPPFTRIKLLIRQNSRIGS